MGVQQADGIEQVRRVDHGCRRARHLPTTGMVGQDGAEHVRPTGLVRVPQHPTGADQGRHVRERTGRLGRLPGPSVPPHGNQRRQPRQLEVEAALDVVGWE